MQNPFTTTFSKLPDYTYIPTDRQREIMENFSFDNPSESVYKITGIRGSGKTVLLGKIESQLMEDPAKSDGWIVYRLSPERDMLRQMASLLYKEPFVKSKKKGRSLNLSATVMGTGGGIGVSSTDQDAFFDIGVEIDDMLRAASSAGRKILIGVDEVTRTPDMVVFTSEFAKWLRAGYPIYLVCTGLYENIEQLYNVKNLTFFRRATTVKTQPLNHIRIAEMYKKQLGVDNDTAKKLSDITKGYPYAFQELGVLYFKNREAPVLEDILYDLKMELFSYSYEKIWEELTQEDRELVIIICDDREYKREEILTKMKRPSNYSVYRDRLLKRGVITARQGYIMLALPFFGEYVREYCI